jgi:hypothetical protein
MATVGGSGDKNRHKQCVCRCLCPRYVFFSLCFFNILTNDSILAQGGLTTTVGVVVTKTGTNDISGRRRWCPNLGTSFFSWCFYNMPHLLLPRLKMGFAIPSHLPGSLASPSTNYYFLLILSSFSCSSTTTASHFISYDLPVSFSNLTNFEISLRLMKLQDRVTYGSDIWSFQNKRASVGLCMQFKLYKAVKGCRS